MDRHPFADPFKFCRALLDAIRRENFADALAAPDALSNYDLVVSGGSDMIDEKLLEERAWPRSRRRGRGVRASALAARMMET
jgi:hypothetical protein